MAEDAARLLGFAFASADLLFELEQNGTVSFALGASRQITGVEQSDLVGQPWRAFISDEDAALVATFLAGLNLGDRRGPIRISLKPTAGRKLKRFAALSACRLPQLDPRISCALTVQGLSPATAEPAGPHGLHTAEGLNVVAESAMRQSAQSGIELNMELVELAGLKQAAEALGHTEAAGALSQVAAALRAESVDGASAGKLDDTHYAFVRTRAEPSERVAERFKRAIGDIGLPSVKPSLDSLELNSENTGEGLRALRVALDQFMAGGVAGLSRGGSWNGMSKQPAADAAPFQSAVSAQRFSLAYQPVVSLTTGETDHFEVLARLGDGASPQESILMAEGMGIIQDLDYATIRAVIAELKKPGRATLRLAANVSARSLMQPAFAKRLVEMIKTESAVRGRLTLEINESAVIDDLPAADAIVRRLRESGCKISLDDFGAGAASIDDLRAIAVDEVKIDGRYIRELAAAPERGSVVVRHWAELCRELKVTTVAEAVETETVADRLRAMGVEFGQGLLFGKPSAEPRAAAVLAPPARRVGAT
jgi:EAL domain-containing protein (putative c-di-GMP-specific phosphodiesterase class I)